MNNYTISRKLWICLFISVFIFSVLFFSTHPPFYRLPIYLLILFWFVLIPDLNVRLHHEDIILAVIMLLQLPPLFFTSSVNEHISNLFWFFNMFLLFIILKSILNDRIVQKLNNIILFFIIILCIFTIFSQSFKNKEYHATLGNPNLWAPFLTYAVILLWKHKGVLNRNPFIYFIVWLVLFINIIFTFSLAIWTSLICLFLFKLVTEYFDVQRFSIKKNILIVFSSLVVFISLTFIGGYLSDKIKLKIVDTGRLYIWKSSFLIIRSHTFGIGRGERNFEKFYKNYVLPNKRTWIHAHNLFINEAVQGGILSMILWMFLLSVNFSRSIKENRIGAYLLLAFIIHNLVDYNLWCEPHFIFFIYLLSMNIKMRPELKTFRFNFNMRLFVVIILALLSLYVLSGYNESTVINMAVE